MGDIIDFLKAKEELEIRQKADKETNALIQALHDIAGIDISLDDIESIKTFPLYNDIEHNGTIIPFSTFEFDRLMVPVDIYLEEGAIAPTYAHGVEDSGADIFTYEDITVRPGSTSKVRTGVSFGLPRGFGIQIKGRSGINSKGVECTLTDVYGHKRDGRARITIREGTVDQGYTGEVYVIFDNISDETITIPKGTKIAQALIFEIPMMSFNTVSSKEELGKTNRGSKGFGSTGIFTEE